ncbi:MAG: peptidoglycan-associated lipoprotein Pal [Candidatus Sedimenticola endophacoides]
MRATLFKLVGVLLTVLALGGCSTLGGGAADEQSADGAAVTDAGGGEASTSGLDAGGALTMQALENPDSPVYNKVIYFDYDISEIHPDYRDTVLAHGALLAANPRTTVTIEGHCDERGSREYNIGLGERRANAVKSLLLSQGAAESQIITISYGEERPAVLGSSESGWAQNRRAVFVYY